MNQTLLEQWRNIAFDSSKSEFELKAFWDDYLLKEKQSYIKLLQIDKHPILGTVKDFSKMFNMDVVMFIGFLDGLNDNLKTPNNMDELTEDTIITLDYEPELLYKSMVSVGYDLSIWNEYNKKHIDKYNTSCNLTEAEKIHNNAVAREWQNKPKCPICQSTNLSKITNAQKAAKIVAFGVFGMGDNGKRWKCNNCGSKF